MEAKWARMMSVVVLVGAGLAACAVPEPTRTPKSVPTVAADSFVPLGELWPSGCRGDMTVGRTVQEYDAARFKPNKPEDIPTRIIRKSEQKNIQDVFDLLTCGQRSINDPEIQDETVKPCDKEMKVRDVRDRLKTVVGETYEPSINTATIVLRREMCPAGTPTPHRS